MGCMLHAARGSYSAAAPPATMADAAADAATKLSSLSFADAVASKLPYYRKRVELFEQFKARGAAQLEAARAAAVPIAVTLPDGSVRPGVKNVTTPLDVAASISKGLAAAVVVAKVNDAVWDVFRPLEEECTLKLCTFEDAEGRDVRGRRAARFALPRRAHALPRSPSSADARAAPGLLRLAGEQTFWHSSAHVLGEVLELTFGCDLTIGPSLEEGFYYDCFLGDRTLTEEDCKTVEKAMEKAVKVRRRGSSVHRGAAACECTGACARRPRLHRRTS